MDEKLKPCPFCGGVAQKVDITADEHDPNAGGSYIACQFCLASSSIAFGDKSTPVDNWNSRADDARIRAEARAEAASKCSEQHFFEILRHWAIDCNEKRVSLYQLQALKERLTSITKQAILADEPKEERQGCFRCRNRPQPGGDRQLCDSCRLIVGRNYDPAPLADEPKEERRIEEAEDGL